ncbi:MAG: ribose transport system substrate-binding protein [Chloroflexota bacterium]|jgi:ABC-type sugar transport system substrate-binding protein|nr:ribose transport system substrate-binding protein [Chloroflexota bacterium]
MKRVLCAAVAVLALSAVVAACGGSDKASDGAQTAAGATTATGAAAGGSKGAVAMSFGGSTIALWNDEIALMKPQIEAAGYEFLTHDPQFKVEKQVQDWEAWIGRGDVKAIMGWPIQVDALLPVTKKANDAGIPVMGYAVAWDGTKANLLTRPEEDGKRLAGDAVKWINTAYPDGKVEVAVLSDRQNDLTRLRVEGLVKGVKEALPNATVNEVAALTRDDGYTAAKQHLTAHPDTTVWLSYSDDNMKGVYQALKDTGVKQDDPKYYLAGMDVTNETLDMIKIPNSIYRQAYAFTSTELADANVKLLLAAASGQPMEDIFIDARLVTPANADEFYVGDKAPAATTSTAGS